MGDNDHQQLGGQLGGYRDRPRHEGFGSGLGSCATQDRGLGRRLQRARADQAMSVAISFAR